MTTLALDEILDVLGDGKWHTVRELEKKVDIPFDKLMKSLAFFSTFNLIETLSNEEGVTSEVKLSEPMIQWYVKVKGGE